MLWPVRPQVIRELLDGHPVDARTTFVRLDAPQRFLQIFPLTHCLHQRVGDRWAFGLALRHDRFGVPFGDKRGRSLFGRREDQLKLFGQPLSAHESYVLVATPFIPFGTVRAFGAVRLPVLRLVSTPTTPSADFCIAVRNPCESPGPSRHDADLPR